MKVLCFGGSNTYGYDPRSYLGDQYPPEYRWVDLLGRACGWEMINAGLNGREIPRREGELDAACRLVSRYQPLHRILIMTGVNDLLQGADIPTVIARLRIFLERLPLTVERIVLIAPPPMQEGTWTHGTDLPAKSREYVAACAILASELGIYFVDTRNWEIEFTFDGVHYTEEGNVVFAKRLQRALGVPPV